MNPTGSTPTVGLEQQRLMMAPMLCRIGLGGPAGHGAEPGAIDCRGTGARYHAEPNNLILRDWLGQPNIKLFSGRSSPLLYQARFVRTYALLSLFANASRRRRQSRKRKQSQSGFKDG